MAELAYKTFKKRFHGYVHLEEAEMQIAYEKYTTRDTVIVDERQNERFSIMYSDTRELRPAISPGKVTQFVFRTKPKICLFIFIL